MPNSPTHYSEEPKEQALDAYSFNMNVHYALNLEPVTHDISKRTLERYINLFEEDDLAKATMDEITTTLVEVLGIKIDKQRLDSTHIFSDMAGFWFNFAFLRMTIAAEHVRMDVKRRFLLHCREFERFSKLNLAA